VLTFPGNPVSALVSFEVFGRPVIRRLAGEAVVVPPLSTYPVAAGWAATAGRIRFLRARREQAADGRVVVRPLAGQGSHQARTLADSDCLVVVPAGVDCLAEGDPVQCLVLDE
jgi:molybdopterin molybdotransferase